MKFGLLFLIICMLFFSGCGGSNNKDNTNQPQKQVQISPEMQQKNFINQYSSPNQEAFHNTLKGFSQEYRANSNEIQKSAVFRKQRDYLLKNVPGGRISNWVGTINSITTTKGGDYATVSIKSDIAGYQITYETWNNPVSDFRDHTMIPINTAVYNQLANINEGEKVVFTAQMIRDRQDGYREGSITERGTVTDSVFIVKFIDIRRLKDVLNKPANQITPNNSQNTNVQPNTYPTQNNNTSQAVYPVISPNAIIGSNHSSADVEGSYVHSAGLTIDNNTSSCWSEGAPGLGIGENIVIHFNNTYKVSGMKIWIGHQKSQDLFYKNARPSAIRVMGSDGSDYLYNLQDVFGPQDVNFAQPINVNRIKLIIEKAKRGTTYEDTCISELLFF